MSEQTMPRPNDLASSLAHMFPTIPPQSVVRCVLDAESAVDYAGVAREDRDSLVERLARAHLEELAPFYVDEQSPAGA